MNFRCPQGVVEIANNLIENNYQRYQDRKPLESIKTDHKIPPIQIFFDLDDDKEEFHQVVLNIKKFHKQNPGSVAVLARRRKLLDNILNVFQQENFPL